MVKVLENRVVDLDLLPGTKEEQEAAAAKIAAEQDNPESVKTFVHPPSPTSALPAHFHTTRSDSMSHSVRGGEPAGPASDLKTAGTDAAGALGGAAKNVADTTGDTVGALGGGLYKTVDGVGRGLGGAAMAGGNAVGGAGKSVGQGVGVVGKDEGTGEKK
jgi:hypothetical protein